MGLSRLLIQIVKAYRLFLSPVLGSSCRFTPTCSAYALSALESQGAAAGGYLTLRRLARCHPWCQGGEDPVPAQAPRFAATARLARICGSENRAGSTPRETHL